MIRKSPHETIVRTNSDLTGLWRDLMGPGGFALRSLWHIFIEIDGHLSPVIVPIDDIPLEPDDEIVRNLGYVMRESTANRPVASMAVLLSRPGPGQMTDRDRRWANAVKRGYGPELCPWPVHLATCDQVQVFAPDDLIAA